MVSSRLVQERESDESIINKVRKEAVDILHQKEMIEREVEQIED